MHAFANDPRPDIFILGLLGLVISAALLLYAWRAPCLHDGAGFKLLSRGTLLLSNNVLLVPAAAAVFLGTLYPMVFATTGLGKISVGPPYFNAVFLPLMVSLLLAMGNVNWKNDQMCRVLHRLRWPALLVGGLAIAGFAAKLGLIAATGLALWAVITAVYEPLRRLRARQSILRQMVVRAAAHVGLGVLVLGVAGSSLLGREIDRTIAPG